jgi:hypothetical protein
MARGCTATGANEPAAQRVGVVSETMARGMLPDAGVDPVGECVHRSDRNSVPCATVIGVAEDIGRIG